MKKCDITNVEQVKTALEKYKGITLEAIEAIWENPIDVMKQLTDETYDSCGEESICNAVMSCSECVLGTSDPHCYVDGFENAERPEELYEIVHKRIAFFEQCLLNYEALED